MIGRYWYTHRHPSVNESQGASLTELRFLSPENIFERIKNNENIHFIDIRSRSSYETSHILDSEWLGLAEIAHYSPPPGALIIIVSDKENSNEQLKEIYFRYTKQKFTFGFLQGGIENWITQGGAVISVADPNSMVDRSKILTVTPREMIELSQTLVNTILLDVREETAFNAGHIPGAVNVPLDRLERDRSSIPSIGSLIVYGTDDTTGFQAGTRLFDMGYFGVRVIQGGFENWQKEKLPVVSTKNSETNR